MESAKKTEETAAPALTCAPAPRGMVLPCPRCGEESATVTLNLADGETLTCVDCDAEFTVSDVRALVSRWGRLLSWLDAMPGDPA